MQIMSTQADEIIRAAKSKATEIGIAVSVVVMDAGGNLKAFSRMDNAWLGTIDGAGVPDKAALSISAGTAAGMFT